MYFKGESIFCQNFLSKNVFKNKQSVCLPISLLYPAVLIQVERKDISVAGRILGKYY